MRLIREYLDIKSPTAVLLGTQKPRPRWAYVIDDILRGVEVGIDILLDWPILTIASVAVGTLGIYELSH